MSGRYFRCLSTSLSYVKQLTLALLATPWTTTTDYLLTSSWAPYAPYADCFTCPVTNFEFVMIDQVVGLQISKLSDPATAVLMYEEIKN